MTVGRHWLHDEHRHLNINHSLLPSTVSQRVTLPFPTQIDSGQKTGGGHIPVLRRAISPSKVTWALTELHL